MRLFKESPSQEEIDALLKAAEAATLDGDNAHAAALRKAAHYKKRHLREVNAGWTGTPVAAFMDNI